MAARRWVLPTFAGSLLAGIGWVAVCVFLLGEWEGKLGPWATFVFGATMAIPVGTYLGLTGLTLDLILERLGRDRRRGWGCFLLCALGPPALDAAWRAFAPGDHVGWSLWLVVFGTPWLVQLVLRLLFAGRSQPPAVVIPL